jgi:hypothetical protein
MPAVATFVTNNRSAYVAVLPTAGGKALSKTISSTAVVTATDTVLKQVADITEVLLVKIYNNDVYVSLHGETPPSQANAIQLVAGTVLEMSKSEWLSAIWIRVSADAVVTALQLRARG